MNHKRGTRIIKIVAIAIIALPLFGFLLMSFCLYRFVSKRLPALYGIVAMVFPLVTTAYILVAIRFEERDLVAALGQKYADYRRRVPMLVPTLRALRDREAQAATLRTMLF